ncbi:septum site-determining protein MinC [Cyanobacterium sp. Dongsha4]|uniref:septum site-determining protein MinC n=1 Tax=Cyanobacterium sp. DS4 TaxID=2878255 RepID=UPI002E7FFF9F|nr:septum site-determining protein MinC [Cyanobacterium sp. Dongsha4]WVL01384.1 septum site-determining protein MinC [Cyanobacterium sp. Dongsha4]
MSIETENQDSLTESPTPPPLKLLSSKEQISIIKKGEMVEINLPPVNKSEANQWGRIIDDFKIRLQKIDKSWQLGTKTTIKSGDRLLDTRQLNELKGILENIGLTLDIIITRRRQTAVAVASAGYSVKQESSLPIFNDTKEDKKEENQALTEPLYLKTTIRSGVEICHPSTIIIAGDVNPGATIIAGGDVLIWGNLRGIAHAGANGNKQALIMALKMLPTQLRIADLVARAPDNLPDNYTPEIAYISNEGIKINPAENFYRSYEFITNKNYWQIR